MVFFTSDLHLGHRNVIRLCNRPFDSVEDMDARLIENWNRKVTKNDTIFILGDLMFRNEKSPGEYLRQLKGKKHLIIGNHDQMWIKKCDLTRWFESVNHLHYTSDDGKHSLTLCHYPMMSWPHMARCYMVHGHIHANTDADYWPLIQCNPMMLNAGVDINNYEPVTFDEIVENNLIHKTKSDEEEYDGYKNAALAGGYGESSNR